jgi:hypothetical protein
METAETVLLAEIERQQVEIEVAKEELESHKDEIKRQKEANQELERKLAESACEFERQQTEIDAQNLELHNCKDEIRRQKQENERQRQELEQKLAQAPQPPTEHKLAAAQAPTDRPRPALHGSRISNGNGTGDGNGNGSASSEMITAMASLRQRIEYLEELNFSDASSVGRCGQCCRVLLSGCPPPPPLRPPHPTPLFPLTVPCFLLCSPVQERRKVETGGYKFVLITVQNWLLIF